MLEFGKYLNRKLVNDLAKEFTHDTEIHGDRQLECRIIGHLYREYLAASPRKHLCLWIEDSIDTTRAHLERVEPNTYKNSFSILGKDGKVTRENVRFWDTVTEVFIGMLYQSNHYFCEPMRDPTLAAFHPFVRYLMVEEAASKGIGQMLNKEEEAKLIKKLSFSVDPAKKGKGFTEALKTYVDKHAGRRMFCEFNLPILPKDPDEAMKRIRLCDSERICAEIDFVRFNKKSIRVMLVPTGPYAEALKSVVNSGAKLALNFRTLQLRGYSRDPRDQDIKEITMIDVMSEDNHIDTHLQKRTKK